MEESTVPAEWEKWMPPSPHREAIIDFLKRGRASLIPRGENEAPLMAFEDGGMMELDKVRFSPKRSFYHAER